MSWCLRHLVLYGWSGFFFFQAEDGIRDLVRSRGLGDVYKRQHLPRQRRQAREIRGRGLDTGVETEREGTGVLLAGDGEQDLVLACLLYTSDAADERSSVDLGGRRIIKKKKKRENAGRDER